MKKRKIEELPWLDGQLLTLYQLLGSAPPGGWVQLEAWSYEWHVMPVEARRDGDCLRLKWFAPTIGGQELKLRARGAGFGVRLEVACPITGAGTQDLYFDGGVFASAKGLGLSSRQTEDVADQHFLQRAVRRFCGLDGKRVSQGIIRLQQQEMIEYSIDELSKQAQAKFNLRVKKDSATKRIKNTDLVDLGTRSGLYSSADPGRYPFSKPFASGANAAGLRVMSAETIRESPPQGFGFTDRYPCVDMRVLTTEGYVPKAGQSAFAFTWASEGGPDCGVFCTLTLGEREEGSLLVEAIHRTGYRWLQRIEVAALDRRNRRAFICPVTGERTERLFLRDDYFASAKAQNLHKPRRKKDDD